MLLTSEIKKIDKKKTGFFRYKPLNGSYLLTNDIGRFSFLDPVGFEDFLSGKIEGTNPEKYDELRNNGFILDHLDSDGLIKGYASKFAFLRRQANLHIIVVTLRCDHACLYCQAGSKNVSEKKYDMNQTTARNVVDKIFESLSPSITIEFQGGEPLTNWETVKFIIDYAQKKNNQAKKKLSISMVTNLTFMNDRRFHELCERNVSICTSLDGPKKIHDRNRIAGNTSSYEQVSRWLRRFIKAYEKKEISFKPSALSTITKFSLPHATSIIDEYLNLGLSGIHLRPVTPFGIKDRSWKLISFSSKEFLVFYRQAMDYIISLNLNGRAFHERFANIFLSKILTGADPDYLDLRSPCGAGTGQLAYHYNGDVYTCDEGRMFSQQGDESFRLGPISEFSHAELKNNPTLKALCISSCLDLLPGCHSCAYKPYCGVCPLYNYKHNGDIFKKSDFLCAINTGMLDYFF